MGERKVLNKYFPPDFDPAALPKAKRVRSEEKQMKVRMMLPMSVRCNTCGNFMPKGTKFNTRMEDVKGETYLGLKIFRFYYRCTACSAEFCMKTDPKNTDYVVEAGATRNYEPWREREKAKILTAAQREEEERGNAMKALENRTLDSKREMDIMSALDEMQSLKARHEHVSIEAALAALKQSVPAEEPAALSEQDEAAVQQMLLQRAWLDRRLPGSSSSGSDEEAGPPGRGPGRGSNGADRAKPRQAAASLPPRSAAAAALMEEEEEEEAGGALDDTGGADGAEVLRRRDAGETGGRGADAEGGNGHSEAGNNDNSDGRPQSGRLQQTRVTEPSSTKAQQRPAAELAAARPKPARRPAVAVVVKKKQVEEPEPEGLASLLGGYGSSGDSA